MNKKKGLLTDNPLDCLHCHKPIAVRNPSGYCDHLYYPENCDICSGKTPPHTQWEEKYWEIMHKFAKKHNLRATDDRELFSFIRSLLHTEYLRGRKEERKLYEEKIKEVLNISMDLPEHFMLGESGKFSAINTKLLELIRTYEK